MRRRSAGRLVTAALVATALAAAACTGGGKVAPSGSTPASELTFRLQIAPGRFSLRSPLQREVAVLAGDQIYLVGGLDGTQHSTNRVWAVNPVTKSSMLVGTVPQPFHDAAGAAIGGKVFVFGGGTGESSPTIQTFDPASRKGAVVGKLPRALSDVVAATIGGTAYLVGGFDGSTPRPEIYSTTDGLHFKTVGKLPVGLRYAAVAGVGGKLVVAGGISSSGAVSAVYLFDPATSKVTLIGHLANRIGHASAFSLGSKVYVAGGLDEAGAAADQVSVVDPARGTVASEAPLDKPLSDAGAVSDGTNAWIVGGWRSTAVTQVLHAAMVSVTPSGGPSSSPAGSATGTVDAAKAKPFAGLLLIADRGNNRLLVVNAAKQIVWKYPDPSLPAPPFRFYFPDDAFWVHGGNAILVSMEENQVIAEIAYPTGVMTWSYGHPGQPGSAPGYLHQPDDAYPYGDGVIVADAQNCRILFIGLSGDPVRQIGKVGACVRGLPGTVGYPNGDTPLKNGDILISELNGSFVDRVKPSGKPVWQVKVPSVKYPSDPQMLADGTFLTVNYDTPGAIVRFTWGGLVLWNYAPTSGPGMLSNPSLAAPLPNGLIAVNDDYAHRVIIIDPATNSIVWQYGVRGKKGSAPGLLNLPDGLDLLFPGGVIPLHPDFPTNDVTVGRP